MQPTLHDGDLLLVRWGAPPRPGRVAVVRLPDDDSGRPRPTSVKRLVRPADGGWWVERDSAAEGVDSWQVGALPVAQVLAVVVARLWPRPARALRDPRE
jgi:SOS-response transcriptional repressor LexA